MVVVSGEVRYGKVSYLPGSSKRECVCLRPPRSSNIRYVVVTS